MLKYFREDHECAVGLKVFIIVIGNRYIVNFIVSRMRNPFCRLALVCEVKYQHGNTHVVWFF